MKFQAKKQARVRVAGRQSKFWMMVRTHGRLAIGRARGKKVEAWGNFLEDAAWMR